MDKSKREKISDYSLFAILYGLLFAVFITFVFRAVSVLLSFLPLWAAIMFGIPIAAIGLMFFCAEERTLLELMVKCIIWLAVFGLIGWEFTQIRERARRHKQTLPSAQIQPHSVYPTTRGSSHPFQPH